MWIVMTSVAKMPMTCLGRYRRVALVQLDQYHIARDLRPARISERTKGILRLINMGKHSVGKTPRAAYQRTLTEAERRAETQQRADRRGGRRTAGMSWGGSA